MNAKLNLRSACFALFLTFSALASGQGDSFATAAGQIDSRLEATMKEHQELLAEITKEKIPLSTEVSKLESEVVALRSERDRLLKLRDSRTIDLETLKRSVDSLKEQSSFIDGRLNEFVREFEARLSVAERPEFEEVNRAARLAPSDVNLSESQRRDIQTKVITSALDRLNSRMGGKVFDGKALSSGGEVVEGRFVSVGPTVYFASSNGAAVGLIENRVNVDDPVVVSIPGASDVAEVASSLKGHLPLDATLGRALLKEKARKSLFEYVEDGGVVGYVILGLGIVALLVTLMKLVQIFGFNVARPHNVVPVLDELDKDNVEAAMSKTQSLGKATSNLLEEGVKHHHEKRGVLEELLFERVLSARPTLESMLPFLAITAAAAPLLGLLGTVIGMIKTFQLITIFGTGDAKSLSSGISEALVTTALGLIVAIPVLILHGMLVRMAKRKIGMLEQCAVAFINGLMTRRHARESQG